jgi:hypothetical protein
VPNTMISVKHLELMALRDIRSFAAGEYVTRVDVDRSSNDWTLVAIARDGADLDRIQYAVSPPSPRG